MTPTQAVILAGGRGERLRPLTDTTPKPMVPIHGKPFLEYLVERLASQGMRRVTLLLGFRPEIIRNHFGDGERFGLRIDYSVTPLVCDTGARIRAAADTGLLDALFLLMYCDNYWPLRLQPMMQQFERSAACAQMTVYRNQDGYSRDNVSVGAAGMVQVYDRSRTRGGLRGVDIGFTLLRRDEALAHVPADGNPSFEATVYPALAEAGRLGAYVTDHRYYSIGSLERLPTTERFLAFAPAVVLDRDGVLNVRPPQAEYVTTWAEFQWLPGAREALRLLKDNGVRVFIMTNQPGIARGRMTSDALDAIHSRMQEEARRAGGEITAVYHCPHGWDDGCACRKPAPGMLFAMQREHHLDLTRTIVYGDDDRDGEAAAAAGAPFQLVTPERGLLEAVAADLAMRDRSEMC